MGESESRASWVWCVGPGRRSGALSQRYGKARVKASHCPARLSGSRGALAVLSARLPHRAVCGLEVASKRFGIAERRVDKALAQTGAQCGKPRLADGELAGERQIVPPASPHHPAPAPP